MSQACPAPEAISHNDTAFTIPVRIQMAPDHLTSDQNNITWQGALVITWDPAPPPPPPPHSLTILSEIKAANETLMEQISALSTSVEVKTEDRSFIVIIQSGERTWCPIRNILFLHLCFLNAENQSYSRDEGLMEHVYIR